MKLKIRQFTLALSVIFIGSISLAPALSLAADSCDTNNDGAVSTQEAIQCGATGATGSSQTPAQAEKTSIILSRALSIC